MDFNPNNHIVKLCLQGMELESRGEHAQASPLFLQAWTDATNDAEKFIAAHFVARTQQDAREKLKWLQTDLELALKIDDVTVHSALPSIYMNLAKCYEILGDTVNAEKNKMLSASCWEKQLPEGPFYHGTKADLKTGDLLKPGGNSNYNAQMTMNHIYFTGLVNGAGLAAALAKGEGRERVYIVEPTGKFENDPNVTDKKFPGNPTRSYRSDAPLRIVGEVTAWVKLPDEELQKWRAKLANNKGEIIN